MIRRLLDGITAEAYGEEFEIVIGCNGCSDETAEVCRTYRYPTIVCETNEASKVAGLNLADQHAKFYPRLYLDADIQVDTSTVRRVVELLDDKTALAAAPRMDVDLKQSSWMVKAFYKVWLQLPYHQRGMIGSGFYALSHEGRKKFGAFPPIIADDGFVRAQFSDSERQTLDSCAFRITAPTNLWDLIRVKTRARLGLWELGMRFPATRHREKKDWSIAVKQFLGSPKLLVYSPAYLFIALATRFRASFMFNRLTEYRWERDESSRTIN